MILIPEDIKTIEKDWPIEWFTPKEIASESQNKTFVMSPGLMLTLKGLDILRNYIDRPIFITDACRFEGYKGSYHYFTHFSALDIWIDGYNSMELMEIVEALDLFTGRGLYPYNLGFIHVDTRMGLTGKDGRVSRWWRDENGNYHDYRKDYHKLPFEGWLKYGKRVKE